MSLSRGRSSETLRRLCSRAPRMISESDTGRQPVGAVQSFGEHLFCSGRPSSSVPGCVRWNGAMHPVVAPASGATLTTPSDTELDEPGAPHVPGDPTDDEPRVAAGIIA